MLLNFCDPRLRPEIKSSAISTDGYEVTNLISKSSEGYLAYSCIKPPVHIDITFLCNVCINHVLIWPSVGSQKSSGFQLNSKSTDDNGTPYTLLSNAFLGRNDSGVMFYPNSIDPTGISTPANFLMRYMKTSTESAAKYAHVLRITIYKTENSVPALRKVEVWGTVSPRCGKDVTASVHALWAKPQNPEAPLALPVAELKTNTTSVDIKDIYNSLKNDPTFKIPESFLDSITWELMTQPIILPSGQIIDQTTLEKHGESQASWGRSLSDPFTGLQFNDDRRPVIASALKARIDKFLLDNSNQNEIKRMPRVLGRDPTSSVAGDRRIIEVPSYVLNRNSVKRVGEDTRVNICMQQTGINSQPVKKFCHKLPAVIPKRLTANIIKKPKQLKSVLTSSKLAFNNSQNHKKDDELDAMTNDTFLDSNVNTLLPNMKRFTAPEKIELHKILKKCECCINSIFYKLPCKHVVCRKVLLSIENSQCKSCGFSYKSCEIERIYDNILNR